MNARAVQPGPRASWAIPRDWPQPDKAALALSKQLVDQIRGRIEHAGGAITFAEYMEQVLYAPGLGYYSAGSRKFGPDGDFLTAPEISPLFAQCFARTCESVLATVPGGEILELGAGSGMMAANLLATLERSGNLPGRYLILERSGELRERQRQTLARRIPHLLSGVHWLDALPDTPLSGIVFANEVIDALPVHRFAWCDGTLNELHVAWNEDRFAWQEQVIESRDLALRIESLGLDAQARMRYTSEINPTLKDWLQSISDCVDRGALVFVDYGYVRPEYYHPQRSSGTLMCHYRHRAHADPFLLPGLQDVTAYIDFTALAEAGSECGLAVKGFTTQAHFLVDTGIDELLAATGPDRGRNYLEAAQQVKTMMLPGEMGERFKAMLLLKGIDTVPPGFRSHDLRGRL